MSRSPLTAASMSIFVALFTLPTQADQATDDYSTMIKDKISAQREQLINDVARVIRNGGTVVVNAHICGGIIFPGKAIIYNNFFDDKC